VRHLPVAGLMVLCLPGLPALAEDIEFRFEEIYNRDIDKWRFEARNEHYPATIEIRLTQIGSGQRDWAAVAFSFSPTPRTHERLRVGFAFDMDSSETLIPQYARRDDRSYLYCRSEHDWGIVRLLYPLAQRSHGHEWYWRVELDDVRLELAELDNWSLALTADFVYSPDPQIGFRDDYGIRIGYSDAWVSATQSTFSLGWSGTTSR